MGEYQSKVDIVYNYLTEKIINGEYRSGEPLIISRISEACHVSIIPVREAIKQLEAEGFVLREHNKSAIVFGLDDPKMMELFELRGVLEGYATRQCVPYLTEAHLDAMEKFNQELREAIRQRDVANYLAIDNQFHFALFSLLKNRLLYDTIYNLEKKYCISKKVYTLSPKRAEHSVQDHETILALLRAGDADGVEIFARNHKIQAGNELISEIHRLAAGNKH